MGGKSLRAREKGGHVSVSSERIACVDVCSACVDVCSTCVSSCECE